MEQLIFIAVIYALYMLFNAFIRRVQKGQQPPAGKRRPRPPGSPAAPETEEIPEILKKLLGIEEPEYVPPPELAPAEPEVAEPPVSAEPPPQPTVAAIKKPVKIRVPATVKQKQAPQIWKMLRSRNQLRQAIMLKEILEAPVSLRRRGFPVAR